MKTTKPNLRFWTWNNGWARITLRPDQALSWRHWEPTDEGYSSQEVTWSYDAFMNRIVREWRTAGRDCDGPLSTTGAESARAEELEAIDAYVDEGLPEPTFKGRRIRRPDWKELRPTRVRDAYAAAMGY